VTPSALEVVQVASFVDLAALERERRGADLFFDRAVRERDRRALHERAALLEERGLRRRSDDDVEVVPPRRVLGHRVADEVVHHRVGVRPARVRQEEELLPCAPELVERRRELGVALDVAGEVTRDGVQDGAVAVRFVDALADVGEDGRVVDGSAGALERLDDCGVDARFAERVERVDPVVARRRRAHLLRVVERLELLGGELAEAVVALTDRLVAVHLEDVAVALVDEETAHGEVGRVGDVRDAARVAARDEAVDRGLDGELVHRQLVVDGQRVVHVEADPADACHPQVAVAEDASRPRDAGRMRRRGVERRK